MVKPKFTIVQSNTLACIKLEQNCLNVEHSINTGQSIMQFSTNTEKAPGMILHEFYFALNQKC